MKAPELQIYKIYTVGHGNREIGTFTDILSQYNIELVVDVRSIPYSRFHPQFRQIKLKDSLEREGVNYLWLGKELGGFPSDSNLYSNGKADYRAIKETAAFKAGIEQVIQLTGQGIKVALMCSESDPNQCHRKHLISDELIKTGISVIHINKYGNSESHAMSRDQDLFL